MSQLRASRRKDDFPYYIELPSPNLTQIRSAVKGEDRYVPRRSSNGVMLAIAIALLLGAVWGLILLWGSL